MVLGGNLNVTCSTFEDNTAIFNGAAIWTSLANVYIENSTFNNNTNLIVFLDMGGAVYLDYGKVTIKDSRFIDNHGQTKGDAICAYDCDLTLSNNTFTDNGDAVYAFFGTTDIRGDNVFNNDTVSINNTLYSTIISNTGIELKLNITSIPYDNLPDAFDLRDYGLVSPVRNQGSMGACWTFGSSGALESALLKSTGILFNLSQDNIQNTMLQYSLYGVRGYFEGAYLNTSVGYFVNWYGPYNTQLDPYDELGKVSANFNKVEDYIHIHDVVFVPARVNATDNDALKMALLEYGAVSIAYEATKNSSYYNEKTAAQYINGSTAGPTHAVSIVGWDDNFSRDNFLIAPPGDGAWIVKNSWGTGWGDEGYFYLSYYDPSFINWFHSVAFPINNTDRYTRNYQTDTGELIEFNKNYTYYSNTYNAMSEELICAVGTYFNESGVEYELKIYVNGVLKHTQKGINPFIGFHTIKLTENVSINANDTFKVVFKNRGVPVQLHSVMHYRDNVSFMSADGVNWSDVNSMNGTAILKAYAIAKPFVPSKPVITGNKDVSLLYSAGTSYKVRVTVDGKAVAGQFVTFKFNGVTKKVKTDANGYATYKIPAVKPKASKYTITASYGGVTVKNTVKVKSIVVAKNFNAKKSAKVLKIKVSLKKVNKKYLKNKKMTLKFKGKTYKVKTNKKGVPIFKIKNVLKKLKVGKKYTYKVSYGKDTVSKKITVKK